MSEKSDCRCCGAEDLLENLKMCELCFKHLCFECYGAHYECEHFDLDHRECLRAKRESEVLEAMEEQECREFELQELRHQGKFEEAERLELEGLEEDEVRELEDYQEEDEEEKDEDEFEEEEDEDDE